VTQFILVELSTPDQERALVFKLAEVDLNLTTAPTTCRVDGHIFEQLENGIIIGSCTNIKHECVVRLQILADTLEEPLVTVNLTIVSLF
jgi:hypothetical protein